MDEKERQAIEEEEIALCPAEEDANAREDEEELEDVLEETAPEEEGKRLYFGRFTPGVWYGGVLGIAFSYIAMGLLGLANKSFSLGIDSALQSPVLKYGLLIVLCYGLGKVGGILEKRQQAAEHPDD